MKEPHPSLQAGSRNKSVRPSTSPEPAPVRAVMEDINSRYEREHPLSSVLPDSANSRKLFTQIHCPCGCGGLGRCRDLGEFSKYALGRPPYP